MTSSTQLNPADLDGGGGTYWDHPRREYLAGVKAMSICQRYGMSLGSFRMHARAGKWRRIDQPIGDVPPEAGEYHPDDDVSFADLADEGRMHLTVRLGPQSMGRFEKRFGQIGLPARFLLTATITPPALPA